MIRNDHQEKENSDSTGAEEAKSGWEDRIGGKGGTADEGRGAFDARQAME